MREELEVVVATRVPDAAAVGPQVDCVGEDLRVVGARDSGPGVDDRSVLGPRREVTVGVDRVDLQVVRGLVDEDALGERGERVVDPHHAHATGSLAPQRVDLDLEEVARQPDAAQRLAVRKAQGAGGRRGRQVGQEAAARTHRDVGAGADVGVASRLGQGVEDSRRRI